MIAALADRVVLAGGWSRVAIAIGCGALAALAMPPVGFWPVLLVSLPGAVWLLDGSGGGGTVRTLLRAATVGWLWGFGFLVGGLWWLGAAFLVEADTYAALMPFGVLGLPAVLAFHYAAGFALARALWSPGWGRIFAMAVGFATAEWMRGHLMTGFPWNALGLALGQNIVLMQVASLIGMSGLTILAALVCAAPATLGTGGSQAARFGPSLVAGVTVLACLAFGAVRLGAGTTPLVPDVKLRLMQPNLRQDAKFRPAAGPAILRSYLDLSDQAVSPEHAGLGDVTHLIWPESAFPFLLARNPGALAAIAERLGGGTVLITGAARAGESPDGRTAYFNAIQAVGPGGAVLASYDKTHLVPFGEYVPGPFEAVLEAIGVRQFVHIPGGFTPGHVRLPFRVPGLPAALPTICYEAIFPDEMWAEGPRPDLILNVTNDGWFGQTAGPYQHFAQARLRAVEQGLPLVRAANTGISAVIDPYGRILASLPLGQEGVLDSRLPGPLAVTPFGKYGRLIELGMYTFCLIAAIGGRRGGGWRHPG